jgi:peptidyl-prolyl cis-trans isomerase C
MEVWTMAGLKDGTGLNAARGGSRWIPACAGMTNGRTKMIIKSAFMMLACFFIFASHLSAAETQDKRLTPVAKVNGVAILQRDLDEATAALIPQASYHQNVNAEKLKEIRKQALENLIREELFYRAGVQKGYRVPQAETSKRFAEIRKNYPTRKAFQKALQQYGITEAGLRKKIEHMKLAEILLKEEVTNKAALKEKDLRDYYQKNLEKFQKPEAVRLSHILIKVPPEAQKEEKDKLKKKAEDILQKLKKDDDFAKLAWDNSDDASRVKGGDLGEVHRGRLEPEVENPAFALKKGELSGLVTSIYGYHILKAVDKLPPRQLKFEEIKDKLQKDLEDKDREKRLTNLVKNLKEHAKIEILAE